MNTPANPVKKNVFISYRVQDTSGETGRLVDALKNHFEEDQVFMDIDKIEPGVDFTEVISRSLDICDVMLAIIGPNWQGRDSNGLSRIKKPDDWVRLELSTALKRNIRVVPVLVDGATLPDVSELPEDLEGLSRRQTYEISNKRWRYDTEQLISFLQNSIGVKPKRQAPNTQPRPLPPAPSGSKSGIPVWLKIVIGIFAFVGLLGIIGIISEASKEKSPDQVQPQSFSGTGNSNIQPASNNNSSASTVTGIDVTGNWLDPDGGIVHLQQSGNKLTVQIFHNNEQTGTGSGYIENGNVEMSVNLLNLAMITYNIQLSADGNEMNGNLTAIAEGKTNTIVTWLKRTNN
jgi:hypothetical protein